MNIHRIQNLAASGVAFDCETHLVQPGLLAPPLVCGSVANQKDRGLLDKNGALEVFLRILKAPNATIIGANIAYDMLVCAVELARRDVDAMPLIFNAYAEGRVYDIQIAEMLHAIAEGTLGRDPRTGGPLRDPVTGKPARYSLAVCVYLVLGRTDAKQNDEWRLRYAELENIPIDQWPENARQYPIDDAVNTLEVAGAQVARNRNLHDLSNQCYAAFAMHLGAAWGITTDQLAVDALEQKSLAGRAEGLHPFIAAGLMRENESKDTAVIKKRVALAYGGAFAAECPECGATGQVKGKGKKLIGCKPCSGTGIKLDDCPSIPRTETGGVQTSRDALAESGDDLLMDFAEFGEDSKILDTYVPFLREGAKGPINLRPNVLLETGRTSYSGVIQLLPRQGGVRECIVPRPGYNFFSVDYSSGELSTHAQSCLWIVGWSKLAEAINSGMKVHDALGAKMAGVSYEDMLANQKANKFLKDCRQAAKPGNFGFPGGMGAPKLVLQQRKQGPDTVTPDGRKYKGLRFCVLIAGATECGVEKVTEWKKRPIPPTCKKCIECAEDLRAKWFAQWPENRPYFEFVANEVDTKGEVVQHVSKRIRGGLEFCAAANGYFQGLLADIGKTALCRIMKESMTDRRSPLWGSRVVLFAHDEMFGEAPVECAPEAADRITAIMEDVAEEYLPDVKLTAEPCIMERWYKGAECVRNEKGRLIPWRPKVNS
jgi:hypothetical protein